MSEVELAVRAMDESTSVVGSTAIRAPTHGAGMATAGAWGFRQLVGAGARAGGPEARVGRLTTRRSEAGRLSAAPAKVQITPLKYNKSLDYS